MLSGDFAVSIVFESDSRQSGTDSAAGRKYGRDLGRAGKSGGRIKTRRFGYRQRETVKEKLEKLLSETKADELMINAMIYDHAERLRSYEIIADVWKDEAEKYYVKK